VQKPQPKTVATETKKTHTIHTSTHDLARHERAKQVVKSPKISRFGHVKSFQKLSKMITVKEPPAGEPPLLSNWQPAGKVAALVTNPLQKAIELANSHTQPRLERSSTRARLARRLRISTRTVNLAAGSLAVVLLAGFFAYLNVPNFSMRIAAARAGVNASLPAYHPAGFSLRGPIESKPGQITLTYRSNSDTRQFTIRQATSTWNNEALVEKYVATDKRPYQTYQASDRTIYIYDTNRATWLNNGVWYRVEGNSSLNSDQLVRLATSL
jgi:hypothetical protein